jgi:hypothetical protein
MTNDVGAWQEPDGSLKLASIERIGMARRASQTEWISAKRVLEVRP